MKKLIITTLIFLGFLVPTKTTEAKEASLFNNDLKTHEVQTAISRPSKIWHEYSVSGGYNPPITKLISINRYGAQYTGTLTLKTGYHSPNLHTYVGWVYNKNVGYWSLRDIKDKDQE